MKKIKQTIPGILLYARTEYCNGNNDSSGGSGRGSYSRGHGRGRGQGRDQDNSQNQGQRNSSKKREENEQKAMSNTDDEDEDEVRFGDGSCVSIKGKGLILFQGKNGEQKLLKDVYYIHALRSNVISLGQVTISDYDISIRGDFLTMRDCWGSLLIKVPRNANRLYKAQLKVAKEDTNEVGQESDEEANPYSSSVTVHNLVHETNPKSKEDNFGSDDMSISIARLETI
ncbi:hypothetical protein Tco_1405009 [Tanacetum coccineum]